jgi:predicted DNA-binding transcriptional regulator YafY
MNLVKAPAPTPKATTTSRGTATITSPKPHPGSAELPVARAKATTKGASSNHAGRGKGRFTQHRKLDRLRDALLSSPQGLTLAEVATVLRVSGRSARRYLVEFARTEELESTPIEPGGPHLWRIKPSEGGRKISIRRAQAFALMATRNTFASLRGSALFEEIETSYRELERVALRPAKSTMTGGIPSDVSLLGRFVVLGQPARAVPPETVDAIFGAFANSQPVRILWARDGQRGTATMLPRGLCMIAGEPWVLGPCLDGPESNASPEAFARANVHGFPLLEIEQQSVLEMRILDEGEFQVADYLEGIFGVRAHGVPTIRFVIEFSAESASSIRGRKVHPSQKVALAPDGRARVGFATTNRAQVKAWVLSFGAAAQVIEPVDLRRELAEEAAVMQTRR